MVGPAEGSLGGIATLVESLLPLLRDRVDLLYVDGHETQASVLMAEAASGRGIPVVMDAGSVRAGSRELVTVCTDVIGAEGFAAELTGREDFLAALRDLQASGPERVGTTFGAGGVLGLDGENVVTTPAYEVRVLDTTGAGDVFHAGYAFARALGEDFADCLALGAAVYGARQRIGAV